MVKMGNKTYLQSQKINIRRLVLALVFIFLLGGCIQEQTHPRAENGYLDLSGWNFNQKGPVKLEGEWEFYWKKLLLPKDFQNDSSLKKMGYIQVPGLWKTNRFDGQPMPAQGYATYRLTINQLTHTKLNALYISDVLSVCNIWVNGRLLASGGQVGKDKSGEHPEKHSIIARFTSPENPVKIVLQVSNFTNMQGGINTPVWFGPDEQIQQMINEKWIITAVFGGTLLLMGFYHMALYGMRRKEIANLYFGLYCVMWASQILFGVNGGCLMAAIFPSLPWRLSIDLTLLPYGFTTPLLIMFYHALFPNKRSHSINRIYQVLGSGFVLYLILTPPNAFDVVVLSFILVSLSAVFYLFTMFINDLVKKKKNIRFLIPGYMVLALTGINDVLYDLHMIDTAILVPYGTFIFILSYSFLISVRFSMAFSAVEKLTVKLQLKNEELTKLDLLKDEFLANTSHELKTPLNGIMGIAQSLMDSPMNTKVSRGLSLITSSSIRLLSLINDLLDFSTLKNRELELHLKPLNIKRLTDSVIMVSAPLIKGKQLSIENQIPEGFPKIPGDENRVSQIFFNLIGNAIKFTNSGKIILTASKQGRMAKIEVADTGIGIPEKKRRLIFQSFEQIDQGASKKYTGTGLGLAIAKELVNLHGGDIGVTSPQKKGSVFWFTLPLYSAAMESLPKTDRPEGISSVFPGLDKLPAPLNLENNRPEDNGQSACIMAVDDDPVNLEVVVNLLEAGSFKVLPCTSGQQALDRIEKGPLPDLILLDIMMPGLSGYDVCRKIRQDYSPSKLPILLLTAKSRIQDLVDGFSAGGNDYLTKPFFKDELLARVKTQLSLKQAFKTLQENLELKKELDIREKRELSLKLLQRRLSGMLNRIDDAVLAVNPAQKIGFCNHAFETLTGYCPKDLLGSSILDLFQDTSFFCQDMFTKCQEQSNLVFRESLQEDLTIKCADNHTLQVDISLSFLDLEEEELLFMILKKTGREPASSMAGSLGFIAHLNRNRERMERLEALLNSLSPGASTPGHKTLDDVNAIVRLLDQLGDKNPGGDMAETKRFLAVEVMNNACDLWAASTRTSKVELADRSGLWSIYIEKDGYARTQTLDKYLEIDSLPARPRWKNIINTADFVLAACEEPSAPRQALEKALIRLKKFL